WWRAACQELSIRLAHVAREATAWCGAQKPPQFDELRTQALRSWVGAAVDQANRAERALNAAVDPPVLEAARHALAQAECTWQLVSTSLESRRDADLGELVQLAERCALDGYWSFIDLLDAKVVAERYGQSIQAPVVIAEAGDSPATQKRNAPGRGGSRT